jgi:hypothetical protein
MLFQRAMPVWNGRALVVIQVALPLWRAGDGLTVPAWMAPATPE